MRKKAAVAAAVGAFLGGIAAASPAEAARCGAMPDGYVELEPIPNETWDNPGEVVSFLNSELGIHSNTFDNPPGQLVRALCAGAPAG